MAALSEAADALEAGDSPRALASLLGAWRETRSERIAAAIDRLSPLVSPPLPPAKGKRRQEHAPWMAAAAARKPADVAWLLETATVGSLSEVCERLALLASWPADPRLSEALVRMVETLPFPGETARTRFWPEVFHGVVRIGDPRATPRLEVVRAQAGRLQHLELQQWLGAKLDGVLKELAELPPPAEPDPAALARVESLLPAPPGAADKAAETDFLAAIAKAPAADGPKLVYADWLMEHGSRWGEFIMLQFKLAEGKATHDDLRHADEIAEKEGTRWLGELGPYVGSPVFEKGFLAAARLEGNPPPELAARLPGHPLLACAKRLRRGGLDLALFKKILSHPSRERFAGRIEDETSLEVVLEGAFPRLKIVTLAGMAATQLSRFAGAVARGALPALQELRIDLDESDRYVLPAEYAEEDTEPDVLSAALREILSGPLSKRLRVARLTAADGLSLKGALAFLDPALGEGSSLVRRELFSEELAGGYLARGKGGAWSRLGLEWSSTRAPVQWLATLRGRTFERLILKASGLVPSQAGALRKAIAALQVGDAILEDDAASAEKSARG